MSGSSSKGRWVTLTSSDDEEPEDAMPKIIDTVSLQGCSGAAFTFDEQSQENDSILYPQCEIKEGNSATVHSLKKESKNEEKVSKEKKRLKLTHLPPIINESGLKASSSRHKDDNIVDANRLALQESLFKTKELFDTFLRVCQDQDNSVEMQKVVDKLDRAYLLARQEYLGSVTFQSILEAETEKVNTSNLKPWLNLKLVLDELKYNKKSSPTKLKLGESEDSQDAGKSDEEVIIECPKKRRHLKKLEKTLRALNLKIKKLEEKEVDLDDEDSSYVKLDRYRAQFTKIYNKVCEIKGKLPDADRPYLRKVSFAGTTYPHINRCIERYYNKHREFPDFQDIKKLVVLAVKQEKLELQPVKIHQMAQDAFKEFGEMLKRLRQYDDYDIIVSYLENQVDPAKDNQELQDQLIMNAQQFKKKEQEVIDKFAAQDAGLEADSDEDSDRPKKKLKIITRGKKTMKPTTPKKPTISSSDSSDDSLDDGEDEKENKKLKDPTPFLESSEESSEEGRQKLKNKGKSLVGKKRLVKGGLKQQTPSASTSKSHQPCTAFTSDEDSDPKDTFTNYLGLHKQDEANVVKDEEVSDGEIVCIQNVKKITTEKNIVKSEQSHSSNSESDVSVKSEKIIESDMKQTNGNHVNGSRSRYDKEVDYCSDSDPPIEKRNSPKLIKEKQKRTKKKEVEASNNTENGKKAKGTNLASLNLQCLSRRRISAASSKISLSSDSDNESAERTSADESEFSAKKSVSDVSKTPSVVLSDHNSSESDEHSDNDNKQDSDLDDSIVILSEDIVEPLMSPQNGHDSKRNSAKESDSDNDICILSPSPTESRTVVPKRKRIARGPDSISQPHPVNTSARSLLSKRPQFATSTPLKKMCSITKKKEPSRLVNGVRKNIKRLKSSDSPDSGQILLPQMINGATRKTLLRCKPASSTNTIPLIEID